MDTIRTQKKKTPFLDIFSKGLRHRTNKKKSNCEISASRLEETSRIFDREDTLDVQVEPAYTTAPITKNKIPPLLPTPKEPHRKVQHEKTETKFVSVLHPPLPSLPGTYLAQQPRIFLFSCLAFRSERVKHQQDTQNSYIPLLCVFEYS